MLRSATPTSRDVIHGIMGEAKERRLPVELGLHVVFLKHNLDRHLHHQFETVAGPAADGAGARDTSPLELRTAANWRRRSMGCIWEA